MVPQAAGPLGVRGLVDRRLRVGEALDPSGLGEGLGSGEASWPSSSVPRPSFLDFGETSSLREL